MMNREEALKRIEQDVNLISNTYVSEFNLGRIVGFIECCETFELLTFEETMSFYLRLLENS